MTKIVFEVETQHGVFRDALYFPAGYSYTSAEVEALKQQRVDNWIDLVTAPPVEEQIEQPQE